MNQGTLEIITIPETGPDYPIIRQTTKSAITHWFPLVYWTRGLNMGLTASSNWYKNTPEDQRIKIKLESTVNAITRQSFVQRMEVLKKRYPSFTHIDVQFFHDIEDFVMKPLIEIEQSYNKSNKTV